MDEYETPVPCRASEGAIQSYAERVASAVEFVPGTPVDSAIEKLGGRLTYLSAADSIQSADGSLFVDGERDFEVRISAVTGPLRDQFTMAHELGHYFLHSDQGKKRIRAERFGTGRLEWEANWFAAAFLMPKAQFAESCRRLRSDVSRVAPAFMVSAAAAQVRMQSLGIN